MGSKVLDPEGASWNLGILFACGEGPSLRSQGKSFENWPVNSDLLMIQQACLPPVNRLVDKRELGSLKANLGISGLTQNFSPIRGLPSASNTLFIVPCHSV